MSAQHDSRFSNRKLRSCKSFRSLHWHKLFAVLAHACVAFAASADEVTLHNGDVLRGTVKQQSMQRVVLDHPDLGEIVIPAGRIAVVTITKPEAPSASGTVETVVAQTASATDDEPHLGQKLHDKLAKWNTAIVFGATFKNDEDGKELDTNTRIKAAERLPARETEYGLAYTVGFSEGVIDDNNLEAIAERAWLKLDSPWFYVGRVRYDFDEFRSWDHRLTGHIGTGYRIVDTDTVRFSPILGIGGRKEVGSVEEISTPEGALGAVLRWVPDVQSELNFESLWHPALTESEHRVVTRASWRRMLVRRAGISLVTNLEHEYDTSPDPGYPEHEWTWTWAAQWDF